MTVLLTFFGNGTTLQYLFLVQTSRHLSWLGFKKKNQKQFLYPENYILHTFFNNRKSLLMTTTILHILIWVIVGRVVELPPILTPLRISSKWENLLHGSNSKKILVTFYFWQSFSVTSNFSIINIFLVFFSFTWKWKK